MNIAHMPADSITDLPTILTKQEQRRAFRRARRHTVLIKVLQVMMPVAALGIIGLYFLPSDKLPVTMEIPVKIDSLGLDSKGLKMINPHYSGQHKKFGRYSIGADYALQQITATHILEMYKISGLLEGADNKKTRLTANKGIYDTQRERMKLLGGIRILSESGMTAALNTAEIDIKKQLLVSDQPVHMTLNKNVIIADKMILQGDQKRLLFEGGVKVKLFKGDASAK